MVKSLYIILFLFVGLLFTNCCKEKVDYCPCFDEQQQSAMVPGGEQALFKFLSENIKYPAEAKANSIQGTVRVNFNVQQDGTLTDIKAVNDPLLGYGLEEEAIRVVELMNERDEISFCPARTNCEPVVSNLTVSIPFVLPG